MTSAMYPSKNFLILCLFKSLNNLEFVFAIKLLLLNLNQFHK